MAPNVCPAGYACPTGTTAAVPCSHGYLCPAGTTNATADVCYAAASSVAAWRHGTPGGVGNLTMVSSTPHGVVLLTGVTRADAGDCNSGANKLPPGVAAEALAAVVMADVNGDGAEDVVAVVPANGSVVAWLNNGNDAWPTAVTVADAVPSTVTTLAVFDGDGDGALEVLTTVGGVVALMARSGNGSWARLSTLPACTAPAAAAAAVVVAMLPFDVDADGDVDVLVVTTAGWCVLANSGGRGVFVAANVYGSVVGITSATASDFDADGDIDVILCGATVALLLLNNGTGGLAPSPSSAVPQTPCAVSTSGDADADGDVDVLVSAVTNNVTTTVVLLNDGAGGFTANVSWSSNASSGVGTPLPAAAVFVDVNDDGVLDVPSVGFVHPALPSPSGVPSLRVVHVRPLGRSGAANQHGATVCVYPSGGGGGTRCAVVASSGPSQPPYDVYFAVPTAAVPPPPYSVSVRYVNGHAHNANTSRLYRDVIPAASTTAPTVTTVVVQDVPVVDSVRVFPTSGVLVPGSVVTVVVTTAWREAGLSPTPGVCCFVNGVDVSASFVDGGDGTYNLSYTVAVGDAGVYQRLPPLALSLTGGGTASSDVVGADLALPSSLYSNFTIATQVPVVHADCVAWNGTFRDPGVEAVAVSCGVPGCVVHYSYTVVNSDDASRVVNGSAQLPPAATSGATSTLSLTSQVHDVTTLQMWAVNPAGATSAVVAVTWLAEGGPRVVLTLPDGTNQFNVSQSTTPEFHVSCTSACGGVLYSLDGGPMVPVGTGGAKVVNATAAAAALSVIETTLTLTSPAVTSSSTATVLVALAVHGSTVAVLPGGIAVVKFRLDGAAAWTDVTNSSFPYVAPCGR